MITNNKTKIFSEEFRKRFVEKNIGYIEEKVIDDFLHLLAVELNEYFFSVQAENNLTRIFDSLFDRTSFIKNGVVYPHYCKLLAVIASNSNYLTDIVVRESHLLNWLLHSDALNKQISYKDFLKEVKSSLEKVSSFEAKIRTLKSIKRREMLRIGVKDILGIDNLKTTTKNLSILAKTIANTLFEISLQKTIEKKNLKRKKINYSLTALGKLGADELNYSSDIDLILFSDSEKEESQTELAILIESTQLFIESISRNDNAGFLYRVDFRLRPDGKTSALCGHVTDYLHYYETRGEDWERQMLIKASFVAGSKKLFNRFYNYLIPFIYPRSFSKSPLEQINRLRKSYLSKLDDEDNIKLSFGGIRDIEFPVQALQLINGGEKKDLRKRDSLSALASLKKNNLVSPEEYHSLKKSYIFFRRIEHFLQLMNDRQTHKIPNDGDLLQSLVRFFNFNSAQEFFESLQAHKELVRNFYTEVFDENKNIELNFDEISFDGFADKPRARKNWNYLKEGIGLLGKREFDNYTLTAFSRTSSKILAQLSTIKNKDMYLENFTRIIRSAKIPSIWYESLSNEKMFEAFSKLILNSQYSVELFAEDYTLRDHFLSGLVFTKIADDEFTSLKPKQLQFILAVQFTLGLIDDFEFSSIKQKYLIKILSDYFSEYATNENYFVACAGSFGANELTFHSDIDLLFVCTEKKYLDDAQHEFVFHLNEIRKILATWNVDLRLRPEGKSSQLVWDFDAYKNYLQYRARIWEFQSLLKIKFVHGDKVKYLEFADVIEQRIKSFDAKNVKDEINLMRRKLMPTLIGENVNIKKSSGGITDIHFLSDYLYFLSPSSFKLSEEFSMRKRLEILFFKQNEINLQPLFEHYQFLKNLELINQNIFAVSTSVISFDQLKIEKLAQLMNEEVDGFIAGINSVMKDISNCYIKILNK